MHSAAEQTQCGTTQEGIERGRWTLTVVMRYGTTTKVRRCHSSIDNSIRIVTLVDTNEVRNDAVEKDSVSNDTFRFVGFEHALLFWARACHVVVGRKFYYGTPSRNSSPVVFIQRCHCFESSRDFHLD